MVHQQKKDNPCGYPSFVGGPSGLTRPGFCGTAPESGSHTPLEDRQVHLSGAECGCVAPMGKPLNGTPKILGSVATEDFYLLPLHSSFFTEKSKNKRLLIRKVKSTFRRFCHSRTRNVSFSRLLFRIVRERYEIVKTIQITFITRPTKSTARVMPTPIQIRIHKSNCLFIVVFKIGFQRTD